MFRFRSSDSDADPHLLDLCFLALLLLGSLSGLSRALFSSATSLSGTLPPQVGVQKPWVDSIVIPNPEGESVLSKTLRSTSIALTLPWMLRVPGSPKH